jgi:hypothetical protein
MDDRLVYQLLCNILIRKSYEVLADLHSRYRIYGNIPIDPSLHSDHVFQPVFAIRAKDGKQVSGQYNLFKFRVIASFDEFKQREGQPWLIRTDIRSYYPSIDHRVLIKLLERNHWLPDNHARELLEMCVGKWEVADGKGIPIGYECSDHIGNLYIHDLDLTLSDFRVHRYVDDFYIFVDSFEQVKDVLHRIDTQLDSLGLQRNTAKTEYTRLSAIPQDKLKEMLSESLSMFAEDRIDPVDEENRQDALVDIFNRSFDSHSSEDSFDSKILDMSQIAFVHNRLRRMNSTVEDVAYYVLDHDLKYAYHALNYLYQNYSDAKYVRKLKEILDAEYEPRALKGLALSFLYKMNADLFEKSFEALIGKSDAGGWHLVREVLRVAAESPTPRLSSKQLARLKDHENPYVLVFVFSLLFFRNSDHESRCALIDSMFESEHRVLKFLGVHFAYRYRLADCVRTTLLDTDMRTYFDVSLLNESKDFFKNVFRIFDIFFDENFPLEKYFGRVPYISQLMRNMYATSERNSTEFVKNAVEFANSVLSTAHDSAPVVDDSIAQGDHYENGSETLSDVIFDMKNHLGRGYVKVGKQLQFKDDLGRVLGNSVDKWHNVEGLRVRNIMFISYSVEDKSWREMLVTAIKSYFGQNPPLWYFEENLEFSDSVRQEILHNRSVTRVAILLTSNNYFASDPIMELEYPYFKEQRDQENLRILWIPCEPSSADLHGLGDVWTPAGIEPLTGKDVHGRKTAIDLAARKLYKYFHPYDSTHDE